MKATEQYFPVVLFIMLHKVVLTFESSDKIQEKDIKTKAFMWYGVVLSLSLRRHLSIKLACSVLC